MKPLTRSLDAMFRRAMELNLATVERALRSAPPGGRLLDLGCDDGARTVAFAAAARAAEVHGVEVSETAAELARARGVTVVRSDLNAPLPLESGAFDVVVSNQVLEHVAETDILVSEIRRLLAPAGLAVVSTENLASWHNVAALVLGWQPFSLGNVTAHRAGLGNPLAIHRGAHPGEKAWRHVRVFSYRGLRELFEAHGLSVRRLLGAGYYPLPARLARLDPRHAAFLTVVAVKPPGSERADAAGGAASPDAPVE